MNSLTNCERKVNTLLTNKERFLNGEREWNGAENSGEYMSARKNGNVERFWGLKKELPLFLVKADIIAVYNLYRVMERTIRHTRKTEPVHSIFLVKADMIALYKFNWRMEQILIYVNKWEPVFPVLVVKADIIALYIIWFLYCRTV